ncbi:A24 family peptidase [Altererythrobacter aquiaggeris]|uniref:A24 family peptidase n=1 Tax=Aestuarierythrobacter aquiaggeris TaxID=1898396 RepID=UPI003017F703
MLVEYFQYGLLIALAIALLIAAITDIQRRQIDNWLNLSIAVGAPLFWWASGFSLWPEIAMQLGVAVLAFAVFATLFAFGAMGGGDVKLLTALALWVSPSSFLTLLMVMALVGGVLTIVIGGYHIARRQRDKVAIPYGVAIAAGGFWVLGFHYLPIATAGAATLG